MMNDAKLRLPESTRNAIAKAAAVDKRHPGLQLDKFSPPGNQEAQKTTLEDVLKCTGDEALLNDLRARRCEALTGASALSWSAITAGALTLHLARTSALENAGICLHPLYGFVYLPGSGLKGMARAYAATVWLASKPEADHKAARADIERVFGVAPKGKDKGSAGTVIFHDAWPETWPKLIVDIVNNHHKKYYGGKDEPGDWENPEPSYFLAVKAGTAFSFALSPRRRDESDLALAKQWLAGALCHLGAGAKTAAGYGAFKLINKEAPPASPKEVVSDETKWTEWSTTLELVTPAFLAGASQKGEDCDLRSATLRGLLRWWWRTMHAAHLRVEDLRALEAAVWGNTTAGSAVRVEVEPICAPAPIQYAFKDGFRPSTQFKNRHGLKDPPNQKTTQGIFYASYGMDEVSRGQRRSRWFMPAGATWKSRLMARSAHYPNDAKARDSKEIEAELVLDQAQVALWLLCHYGGVGSKSRKGFGSLRDIEVLSLDSRENMPLDTCKEVASKFRRECGFPEIEKPGAETPDLGSHELDVLTPWQDSWFALDQLGYAVQAFAQEYKHKPEKIALGLPRKIHGPRDDGPVKKKDGTPVQDPTTWKPPVWLGANHPKRESRDAKEMRDAAPIHYHLAKAADGNLTIRVAAFPSSYLPDRETSERVLAELLEHLRDDLARRIDEHRTEGQKSATTSTDPPACEGVQVAAPAISLKRGDRIDAVLIEEKTSKRGWKARYEAIGWTGYLHNSTDVPADAKPGDPVTLFVDIAKERDFRLLWPTPKIEAEMQKSPPPQQRRGGPRRR